MDTYVPSNVIVHETSVFFESRNVAAPIHIVQYDDQLPVVAVSLFRGDNGSEEYVLPSGAIANLRYVRPDGGVAYNAALGKSADSKIVYFEVTQIMAMYCGKARAVVEIDISGKIACSSPITFEIDRNPVQEGQIEASDEFTAVTQYAEEARQAALEIENLQADGEAVAPDAPFEVIKTGGGDTGLPLTLYFKIPRGQMGGAGMVAEGFSTTKSYPINYAVVKDGALYVSKVPVSAGAWDASQWEEVTVAELLDNKANINGLYDDLGAGTAGDLRTDKVVTDNKPYIYRKSGAGYSQAPINNREYLSQLTGVTLNWNQLIDFVQNSVRWKLNGTVTQTWNNGVLTLSNGSNTSSYIYQDIDQIKDHIYLAVFDGYCTFETYHPVISSSVTPNFIWQEISTTSGRLMFMVKGKTNTADKFEIRMSETTSTVVIKSLMFLDLTATFGTELADLIYGLETAHAGDGVAWLQSRYPKLNGGYYAYYANTLESVCTSRHIQDEFNLWDEIAEQGAINPETGAEYSSTTNIRSKNFIPVIPKTTYYIQAPATTTLVVCAYDDKKRYITYLKFASTRGTFTIPANATYIRFGTYSNYSGTYGNDICINFSDPSKNGTYKPHVSHTYELGGEELRGIMKPIYNASNVWTGEVYYDGDTKVPDGTITRKYGIIDMGTLTWSNEGNGLCTTASLVNRKIELTGLLCSKYVWADVPYATSLPDMGIRGHTIQNYVTFRDTSFTNYTPEQIATALSGVYLLYELATPTTEQGTPYSEVQLVSADGTEYFVDAKVEQNLRDVEIPVGHVTNYPASLRKKVEDAPENPSENGEYAVEHSSSGNEYVRLENTAALAKKANTTGRYPYISVGNADQLNTDLSETSESPYNYAPTGGLNDVIETGDRVDLSITYGTVIWNQLINPAKFLRSNGVLASYSNGIISLTGESTSYYSNTFATNGIAIPAGHIVLLVCKVLTNPNNVNMCASILSGLVSGTITGADHKYMIGKVNSNGIIYPGIYNLDRTAVATYDGITMYVNLIDLTKLFGGYHSYDVGATPVEEKLFALESNAQTKGQGVAWLQTRFPKLNGGYYSYNVGTPMSSNPTVHKTYSRNMDPNSVVLGAYYDSQGIYRTGQSNQYGATPSKMRCFPNTEYGWSFPHYTASSIAGYIYVKEYDANGNFLRGSNYQAIYSAPKTATYTTSSDAYYISWYAFRNDGFNEITLADHMVFQHWDATIDGKTTPYKENVYPIEQKDGLGMFVIDGADLSTFHALGDTQTSDGNEGTFTHNYGIIDLGTLTYYSGPQSGYTRFYSTVIPGAKTDTPRLDILCSIYMTSSSPVGPNNIDKAICGWGGRVYFRDDSHVAGDIVNGHAAWLEGVYLIYPLAEPTTESCEPFINPQEVDNWGTEYLNDVSYDNGDRDVEIPVGNVSVYPVNLRDKTEALPNIPSQDGVYLLNVTNGKAEYIAYLGELPTDPSSNGTYTLKCTVSSGTATKSWVADT